MQYIPIVLRSVLIIIVFSGTDSEIISSEKLETSDQTIEAIKKCMDSSPSPWLNEWKKEYIEMIRNAMELNRDVPNFALRLEILSNGFSLYWDGLKKTDERSLFEVHLAQIRWYIEHLMSAEFPSQEERQKLRDQYEDLWDNVADSLLAQFPFLDPNAVQKAKQDDLSVCYSKIDAPLIPVYLEPMSEEQVVQIKQHWDKLRYERVDLLYRLDNNSKASVKKINAPLPNQDRDYELTKKSLSQLLGLVWMVVPQRPGYYLNAIENQNKALQHRIKIKRQARNDQQCLEKTRSRQLLQIEHISFLFAALLETTRYLDRSESVRTQEQIPSEQKDKHPRGGDAHAIGNDSEQKLRDYIN